MVQRSKYRSIELYTRHFAYNKGKHGRDNSLEKLTPKFIPEELIGGNEVKGRRGELDIGGHRSPQYLTHFQQQSDLGFHLEKGRYGLKIE